jgi:hypothetical protein
VSVKIYERAEGAGRIEESDSSSRTVGNILTIGGKNYVNRCCVENRRSEFSFPIFIIFSHIPYSLLELILDN